MFSNLVCFRGGAGDGGEVLAQRFPALQPPGDSRRGERQLVDAVEGEQVRAAVQVLGQGQPFGLLEDLACAGGLRLRCSGHGHPSFSQHS
jgi:hypothetical protein